MEPLAQRWGAGEMALLDGVQHGGGVQCIWRRCPASAATVSSSFGGRVQIVGCM